MFTHPIPLPTPPAPIPAPPPGSVDERAEVTVTPAWLAGDDTNDAVFKAARAAGWPTAIDDMGNGHARSTSGRVYLGFLPEELPEELHPFTPLDLDGPGHEIRGIWTIDGRPYGDLAWTMSFNDARGIISGIHVPQEIVAAAVTELAAPGHQEPDWLADPGDHDTVWAVLRAAGWSIDHAADDDITAHAPDRTARLLHKPSYHTDEYSVRPHAGGWTLTAGPSAAPNCPGRWEAEFSGRTPAGVITAVMRVMTGPGLPRHPEDVPAHARR
ncbi:DUF317 domain-containing protein [Embleya sp. NPDC059237]|uniref:DUF317 domain-containing protein n=1 Tax=Embleya sp. NPDC059237 TaxID=3346784 RepID=UPI0036A6BFDF